VFSLLRQSRDSGTLQMKDVYDLPSRVHFCNLTDQLQRNWCAEQKRSSQHPNFIRAAVRAMGCKLFLIGLLLILHVSSFFSKYFFLKRYRVINRRNQLELLNQSYLFNSCNFLNLAQQCRLNPLGFLLEQLFSPPYVRVFSTIRYVS
jgi:hypothetical protein